MRKAQKRQIEETIRQMEEAHDEIKRCIEKRIAVQAGELLADCQNAAVAIGTLIEETEGEGHSTVKVLEEYCELVYQIHEELLSDSNINNINCVNTINANKVYKSLRQKLIKASNSITNNIKIRTEAVFLPYKASMWDSLESVWKAADADPDCDAYVIPIPYFDKNPDGSFKEEHYEGNQYPNYVPVTHYDTFDFGKHMPDVIYIHNAYDDWNLVTSVHPDFYSRNLKNYTEELVYIPYFVLGEIDPDNEQAVEGMKHFCFMPGIINADKVIVQSENMKKIYVREYLKAAKGHGLTGKHLDRAYLEKKFLGTGSPKFDKVKNTKKEDLEIPDEWLKIIEKPDGSWKKIALYNTSVGAFLQHSEKMLKKMESVFEIFKEYKDEVALLWRPHPLIQATIESMRLQLWEAYQKIKSKYIEEGWGIYDNTPDIDRAIEISDVYYGDPSSVVALYEKTGKPIMMQDVEILKSERFEYDIASAEAICTYQSDYYFVCMWAPLLCRMNRETLECEVLYRFRGERAESRIYKKIIPYHNKLFIVPFYSEQIAVYDIISGEIQFVSLNEDYVDVRWQENQVSVKFEDALQQGKFLYMIPHSYHALTRMDMDSLALEEIPLGRKGKEIFYYCLGSACLQKNWLVFPIYSESSICFFNLDTNGIDKIYPIGMQKKYSNIFAIGDRLWLIPEKLYKGIDIWDMDSGAIRQTLMLSNEINLMSQKNESMDIKMGFLQEGKLYLLPYGLERGLVIDLDSGIVKLWDLPYEYKEERFSPEYRYMYKLRYNSILHEEGYTVICGLRGEWTVSERDRVYVIERKSLRSKDLTLALAGVQPGEIMWEGRLSLEKYITLRDEAKHPAN